MQDTLPEEDIEEEKECELCGGEGIVYIDEDDGEGHMMRGVAARACICRLDYEI